MAQITSHKVNLLQKETGHQFIFCEAALVQAQGNYNLATLIIKEVEEIWNTNYKLGVLHITASMVVQVRKNTSASMMDCKKAIIYTKGNVKKAIKLLRKGDYINPNI